MNLCGKKSKISFLFSLFLLLGIFSAAPTKAATFSKLVDVWTFDNTLTSSIASTTLTVDNPGNLSYPTGKFNAAVSNIYGSSFYETQTYDMPTNGYSISYWYKGNGNDYVFQYFSAWGSILYKYRIESNNVLFDGLPDGNTTCSNVVNNIASSGIFATTTVWHLISAEVSTTQFKIYYNDHQLLYSCDLAGTQNYSGKHINGSGFRNNNATNGIWDDFAIYNDILTANEMTGIYNASTSVLNYSNAYCGDASCNDTETFNTCPQDCPLPPEHCGDNICNGVETFSTCPQDCPYIEDTGSFWTQPIHTCYYGNACILTFAFNTQIFHAFSDEISLTQCESKDLYDEETALSCATSEDLGTYGVPAAQELYLNDPGTVSIPIPSTNWATSSQLTLYGAKIQGTDTFQLVQFYVKWIKAPEWLEPPVKATSSMLMLFGTSTTVLACSAEDWTKANESTSWFNWTDMRCHGTKQVYDLMAIVSDRIEGFVNQTLNSGKNIFPFSLMIKVGECYKNSATSTISNIVPAGFLDNNGNLVGVIEPENSYGLEATTTIISFGPTEMIPPKFQAYLNWWIDLTTYITWFAFIFGLLILGGKTFEIIMGGQKNNFQYSEKNYFPFTDE